jgi:hypothetical protein
VVCQHDTDDKTPPDSGYTTPSQHTLSNQEFEAEWNVDERSLEYEATFLGRQKTGPQSSQKRGRQPNETGPEENFQTI